MSDSSLLGAARSNERTRVHNLLIYAWLCEAKAFFDTGGVEMPASRVLLVEDDESYAKLVRRALARIGPEFDVQVVDCLTSALQALRERLFNLLILDLNLPDASGLQALDAVHAADPLLPIVVLTALDDEGLPEQALSRGAQQCLHKSKLDKLTLVEAMRSAVRVRRTTPPQKVDDLLTDLEDSLNASADAMAVLDKVRHDPAETAAVQTLGSHIGKMRSRISNFRHSARIV